MISTFARPTSVKIAIALTLTIVVAVCVFPEHLVGAYCVAYWVMMTISIGALVLLFIHGLTGGRWGETLQQPARAVIALLPFLALAMIPLLFLLPDIFTVFEQSSAREHLSRQQQQWLQHDWFIIRTVFFWLGLLAIVKLGFRQSRHGKLEHISLVRTALALIGYSVLMSFFVIDWLTTLTPPSHSTMIGFLAFSEQVLTAMAFFAIWFGIQFRGRTLPKGGVRDIGNLLFAAVGFRIYCLFVDYLIVWEGNLPHEIVWYTDRNQYGLGHGAMIANVILTMALPTLLLLFNTLKHSATGLSTVGSIVLSGMLINSYWLFLPVIVGGGQTDITVTLVIPALVMGFAGAIGWVYVLAASRANSQSYAQEWLHG